jgi:hypothetical protein
LIGDDTSTNGFSNSISIGRATANTTSSQLNLGNVIYANNIYTSSITTGSAQTNGMVGINTNTPAYTLDVSGSIQAATIILNSGTVPETAIEGQIYYNFGDKHFYGYNGSGWIQLDNS